MFLVGIPVVPYVFHESFAFDVDDLSDRQAVFVGEFEVAFIVSGNSHHGAIAIAHQDIIADPDFNQLVG